MTEPSPDPTKPIAESSPALVDTPVAPTGSAADVSEVSVQPDRVQKTHPTPYRGASVPPPPSVATQWLFKLGWFVVVPLVFAQLRVFLLAALPESPLIETLRGQPIPVSIVLFTFAAMVLWGMRWSLPGSSKVGIGGRAGHSARTRKRFDHARGLREEVRSIRRAHGKEIDRTLRVEHRKELDDVMIELAESMDSPSFDAQRFDTAFDQAQQTVNERLGRFRKSEIREYAESILVAIMVALGIRAFVIEAFKIPSGSMIPTLLVGDHIFVNKLAYGPLLPFSKKRIFESLPPRRGDVIVFAFPEKPEDDFIKRVIGLPGDKIELRQSRVWLNDKPIPRCKVGKASYSYLDQPDTSELRDQDRALAGGAKQEGEGILYVEFLDGRQHLTFSTTAYARPDIAPFYPKEREVYVMGDNRNNSRDSREWWGGKGGGVPFENIRGRALWIWLSLSPEGSKTERIGTSVMGRPRLPVSMRHLQPELEVCLGANPPLDMTGL